MHRNIFISGNGRSGSNILLDCLDLSQYTHCRNEPHSFNTSPFYQKILQHLYFDPTKFNVDDIESNILDPNFDLSDSLNQHWDSILEHMQYHWSDRDRIIPNGEKKNYINGLFWDTGLFQFLNKKNQLRKKLSVVIPSFKGSEFQFPSWFFNDSWGKDTVHVFKVLKTIEFCYSWLSENYPQTPIIHLIRYPGGFYKSLTSRFFSKYDEQGKKVFETINKIMLSKRLNLAKEKNITFPEVDIDSMNLLECTFWNWLVMNELIYSHYAKKSLIKLVVFENLICDPINEFKSIYDYCGLPWSPIIEEQIGYVFSQSAKTALSFRQALSTSDQDFIHKTLQYSSLPELWSEQLWQNIESLADKQKSASITYDPFK